VTLALLIFACAALLADAWSTRRALVRGRGEGNAVRELLIATFGLNGGTYGFSVAICAALAITYSPSFAVAYAALACGVTYIVVRNVAIYRGTR
jgi:hypothetical protein